MHYFQRAVQNSVLEALSWIALLTTIQFLIRPVWMENVIIQFDQHLAPVLLIVAFGTAVTYLRKTLLPSPHTLSCQTLRITDKAGRTRIVLTADSPQLSLFSTDSNPEVLLKTGDKGPSLVLTDGATSLDLAIDEDGPSLTFFDKNLKSRVSLYLDNTGSTFSLQNEENGPRVVLWVDDDGPQLSFWGPEGTAVFSVP
jgi:hypothetical protein